MPVIENVSRTEDEGGINTRIASVAGVGRPNQGAECAPSSETRFPSTLWPLSETLCADAGILRGGDRLIRGV